MTVYERGETYSNWTTVRELAQPHAKVDPDSISISIDNPCGAALITDASMISDSTGVYYYNYDLSATADYGQYKSTVSVTLDGAKTISTEYFYILPWDAVQQTRAISGIGESKSISDDDLAQIILSAIRETERACFKHHIDEKPRCNCEYESCKCSTIVCSDFDGTKTDFWTRTGYIADFNHDGSVTGWGEQSCGTDIFMRWKDCDGTCYDGYVTVLDEKCGKVKLTQDGTTPIPANYAWVRLEYWTEARSYDESLFKQAVHYLAAHKVLLRFGELERATTADLVSAQNVKYINPQRMYKEYRRILRKIRDPLVGGAITNP